MGFIEKRSGGYRARYRDPLGRLTSKTFTRKADAERWTKEMEVAMERGDWLDPRNAQVPLATWAEEFLSEIRGSLHGRLLSDHFHCFSFCSGRKAQGMAGAAALTKSRLRIDVVGGNCPMVESERVHQERLVVGDAFGQVLLACESAGGVRGAAFELIERSDGHLGAMDAARYFAPAEDWAATTRFACDQAKGRVLDVGAGAGRTALALQDRGHEVVALDISPGATDVCRRRGVRSTFTGTVFDLAEGAPEPFDSFLMLGNNLGLLGGAVQAPRLLDALASIARPGAQIVGETLNPYSTANPDHLRYHEENRRLGRLAGQLRLRVRHLQMASPWWDYLLCTPEEIEPILAPTPWRLSDVYADGTEDGKAGSSWPAGQWTAVLALRS